jgi:pyruvate/2-oxoglutarate/acetoin dehydrogenase E1 component/TPP-dependent pyruvate/acetoin dehydrogenase alpha subunit
MLSDIQLNKKNISFEEFKKEVLTDYKLAWLSRHLSVLGKKEVLTGKAKFGIFGDGKEVAQIAMAKMFRDGDWRSGYYRDQTFLFATGISDADEFFAQLYGDTNVENNKGSGGRSFNNHYCSRTLNEDGTWKVLTKMKNSAADLSPTAAQVPRLLGLAYASKLFRENKQLESYKHLSINGNEVAFGTIGDASTSEGHFFEVMNAAGVLQVPLAMAVWDDGYGISVPKNLQTIKNSISEALQGFSSENESNGILIYKGKGWDYPGLCKMFADGITTCREKHIPVLFHVEDMVQPLGHSTSGSHERYKSPERLEWEKQFDPMLKMKEWMLEGGIASETELEDIKNEAFDKAKAARDRAWENYRTPIDKEKNELLRIIGKKSCVCKTSGVDKISIIAKNLKQIKNPIRKDIISAAKKTLRYICSNCPEREELQVSLGKWLNKQKVDNYERYNDRVYNESEFSALNVTEVNPVYSDNSPEVYGREIIRDNFDHLFNEYPLLVTFGEDTGKLGDVNQGLEGMQEKYGAWRVADTGIREASIIGQGIGLALRGLRPIAEIQYFDYLLYGLQTMSDDLASMFWRTKGGQAIPLIIRTRGHRFEGIWHAGSPLSMVINSIRGVYVCVPRNMTQAAGMYNTLLRGHDPALVVEPLSGYRLREQRPDNTGKFTVPLGKPEVLVEGTDVTLVTYGPCVRIAQDAVKQLKEFNIHVELIDIQTLLPFDINEIIVESVKKTNRVIFFDEDVPGGASAFMMHKVLEEQNGFRYLDTPPITITAAEHRPAYATDGDYFSNPNAENVFEKVYELMNNVDPMKYPKLY